MKRPAIVMLALGIVTSAAPAWAQAQQAAPSSWQVGAPLAHRAELVGYLGYAWSSGQEVFYGNTSGDFDVKSNAFWGGELNVNIRPGVQLALIYNRMDTSLDFEPTGPGGRTEVVGDFNVEYLQAGGLSYMVRNNLVPFGGITLGATRYSIKGDDAWKFSIMPQVGLKIYLSERLGIRGQARLPITFLDGGFGVGIGTGGASVGVGGTGVVQGDLSAGVMLLL